MKHVWSSLTYIKDPEVPYPGKIKTPIDAFLDWCVEVVLPFTRGFNVTQLGRIYECREVAESPDMIKILAGTQEDGFEFNELVAIKDGRKLRARRESGALEYHYSGSIDGKEIPACDAALLWNCVSRSRVFMNQAH